MEDNTTLWISKKHRNLLRLLADTNKPRCTMTALAETMIEKEASERGIELAADEPSPSPTTEQAA